MEQWHERLQGELDRKGWTAVHLAKVAGVPVANVYKYLRGGVAAPHGDTLPKLARALGTTREYLLLWIRAASDRAAGMPESGLPLVSLQVVSLERLHEIVGRSGKIMLHDDEGERMVVPRQFGDNAIGVHIKDDAMAPRIPPGAIVIIDPDAEPEPGKLVAATVKGHTAAVIRRYRRPDGSKLLVELVPENQDHPRLRITPGKDGPSSAGSFGSWCRPERLARRALHHAAVAPAAGRQRRRRVRDVRPATRRLPHDGKATRDQRLRLRGSRCRSASRLPVACCHLLDEGVLGLGHRQLELRLRDAALVEGLGRGQ